MKPYYVVKYAASKHRDETHEFDNYPDAEKKAGQLRMDLGLPISIFRVTKVFEFPA